MNKFKNGLHKLLNDDMFWIQYKNFTLNYGRFNKFREYRSKGNIPNQKTIISNFIIEDYQPITRDTRAVNEIALELVSPVEQ